MQSRVFHVGLIMLVFWLGCGDSSTSPDTGGVVPLRFDNFQRADMVIGQSDMTSGLLTWVARPTRLASARRTARVPGRSTSPIRTTTACWGTPHFPQPTVPPRTSSSGRPISGRTSGVRRVSASGVRWTAPYPTGSCSSSTTTTTECSSGTLFPRAPTPPTSWSGSPILRRGAPRGPSRD